MVIRDSPPARDNNVLLSLAGMMGCAKGHVHSHKKVSWQINNVGRSLLGGAGLSGMTSQSMESLLGGTLSSLAQYRAQKRQIENNTIFSDIQMKYGAGNLARQTKDMLSGAIVSYGRSLMLANHAGGVMPNYFSETWNKLSEGWGNYVDDLDTIKFNRAQMNATFSAHRSANQLSLFSNMIKNIFDVYETERSRVPRTQERRLV